MNPSSGDDATSTRGVFLYFTPLILIMYLVGPTQYLVDIPTTYMLKDHLQASATQVSIFRLITALPVYVAVLFGLTRDLWSPIGRRDRGYFLIFGPATAAVFIWLAFSKLSFTGLFVGVFLVMLTSRFTMAAYQGLQALVAQEKLMSGRLAVLWQLVATIPIVAGAWAGGVVAKELQPQQTFLMLGVLTALIGLLGLWKPRSVFDHAYDRPEAKGADLIGDLKRLARHKAVYPAVLILFLFQFSPGSNTPLQYYLTNRLHASDAVYGEFQAIFAASFVPMFFLYGWLCRRVPLKSLLFWGTILTIPQMIPLAFIHTPAQALWIAVPIGMMGGIAYPAYLDLAMRSCPPGLQGALMMMADGMFYLSYRAGDLLGSAIYSSSPRYGFVYCVIAITVVYALILPVLLLIPKGLADTRDGEANPSIEAVVAAEIAEAAA
ncbi:MAG TPA: MFS transporter [Caulobacteraceae bacterium]|nr:MFS transporter [Caulobacteraceae bacterium]